MGFKSKNEIVGISKFKVPIQAAYRFGVVIWQAVRSCFGSGIWVNEKPWINDEAWKNE
jgi:hypothetical protein